jgi:hypothetical protein
MSTSSTIKETEPQTIADLGGEPSRPTAPDPKGDGPKRKTQLGSTVRCGQAYLIGKSEGLSGDALDARMVEVSASFCAAALAGAPPPPSEFESLKDDVRQLKASVEALRDAYNRHHHAHLDGSQTSPTSVHA